MWVPVLFLAAVLGCAALLVISLRAVLGDLDDLHDIWVNEDDDL